MIPFKVRAYFLFGIAMMFIKLAQEQLESIEQAAPNEDDKKWLAGLHATLQDIYQQLATNAIHTKDAIERKDFD